MLLNFTTLHHHHPHAYATIENSLWFEQVSRLTVDFSFCNLDLKLFVAISQMGLLLSNYILLLDGFDMFWFNFSVQSVSHITFRSQSYGDFFRCYTK